jgi:transposase
MRQLPLVEQAMGRQTLALVRQLEAACASADDLAQAAAESFEKHPDAEIITSFPGLGALSGARVLAEIGDDRSRFADARRVKNQRLAATGYMWAFAAMAHSDGARAHYDRRREAGDRHTAAQRNLFNHMLGCLHHCLIHRVCYNESAAFPTPSHAQLAEAA